MRIHEQFGHQVCIPRDDRFCCKGAHEYACRYCETLFELSEVLNEVEQYWPFCSMACVTSAAFNIDRLAIKVRSKLTVVEIE